MVDVSGKTATRRKARACAEVVVGKEIMKLLEHDELLTKKGPVFQTAILSGIMAAKKTAEIIPLCHPLPLEVCTITIAHGSDSVHITAEVITTGKTGVEMEALTAASVAALTVYDMCKALSHDIAIRSIHLMEKTGGKNDYRRK